VKSLIAFLIMALAGFALYVGIFGFVVDRPMTLKPVTDLVEFKRERAAATSSPKIAILAGSNARMSHACSVIQKQLGRPCVNLGTTAGLGLAYMFNAFKDELKPGDVVYMPLEYPQYGRDRADLDSGPDAAILFRHDKAALVHGGAERLVYATFLFDVPVLIRSVGEMAMSAAGIRRRFDSLDEPDAKKGEKDLDSFGDGIGHNARRARLYRNVIDDWRWKAPDLKTVGSPAARSDIADFLRWACERKILVIGGLPTTFDDAPIPPQVIASLRDLYTSNGQAFLALPNHSQYGRSLFYDSQFHLNREAQLAHSKLLAEALRPMLAQSCSPRR
jgi:hypothetical protein